MTDNSREGWIAGTPPAGFEIAEVKYDQNIQGYDRVIAYRVVPAADDRGDGNEAACGVVTASGQATIELSKKLGELPDELAIAVERVSRFADLLHDQHSDDAKALRLILSRLASQEAEIEEARTLDKGFYEWMTERDLLARGSEVEWHDIVVALTEHEHELCAIIDRKEETIRATQALAVPGNWKDRDDQWSDEIEAVHPVNSTDPLRHKRFETAMEMVGNRHGKYELVGLVQWLLTRCDKAEETIRADGEALKRLVDGVIFTAGYEGRRSYSFRSSFAAAFHAARARLSARQESDAP